MPSRRAAKMKQKSGRYTSMRETSLLWDAQNEVIYIGSTSEKNNDICLDLLYRSFEVKLGRITSSNLVSTFAEEEQRKEALNEVTPSVFAPNQTETMVTWWNGMNDNYDFLGNEFLLWLWWNWETKSDTIQLSDGSTVTGMFARSLSLDCPQGEFGKETISSESPVALPEAALAIRLGKLPRKTGLTLVRNGEQFDFTLQAETFSVSSAKITAINLDPGNKPDAEDRIASLREIGETLDLLFYAFCERRIGKPWKEERKKIAHWLRHDAPATSNRSAA